ncbi:ABC transporter ATP-binding protein [Caldalkalibacillus mannanilyticus]|uniref:ABC transporter ATP-binding protein n=1 Tax=Caldalkalibacillus mannanilyticus TaxID=1418 RepID=UPI000469E64A|nr:ABC transporter transmembrane domain-containing protein [Caldalkalibacillus mannanilyticus]
MNPTHKENISKKHAFQRLLAYMKPHWKHLSLAFIFLLMATAAEVIGPILIKIYIDDYLTPRIFDRNSLLLLGGGYLLLHFTAVGLNYYQLFSFQKIAQWIIRQIRIDVFAKVQKLGLSFFDQTPVGSLVSRITNDTEAIKDLYVSVLSTFLQSIVFLIGIFIAMFYLDVQLALFCLFLVPIIFSLMAGYRYFSSKVYHLSREKLSQLNAKLNESLQGMNMIQALRQQKRLRAEFGKINEEHNRALIKNIKLNGLLLRPATDLVYLLAIILVMSFFGIKSMDSPIQIGVIYAFITYLDRFFEPINMMMMRLAQFQQATVSAERVFGLLDEKRYAPQSVGQENQSIQNGKIEFKDVSFSYDGKTQVLKNISFVAHPGETVALVGHTGSGKSSITNLLMNFYQTSEGEILIDDIPLAEFSQSELRNKMGLVLQDPFLFVGDIKHNIHLGNETIEEQEIIEAATFVQAHEFIAKLPEGYNEPVGERGATFSSGQRQLLSFARTMVKKPKILVLDEATANVDTETEEYIQEALQKMRLGRTTIAIAHRLSTIQDADLILVLHRGEIVERGTHQQLIEKKGLYYKMYLLQQGSVASEEITELLGEAEITS